MFVNTVVNPLFKQVHYEPTNSSTPTTFPMNVNITEKVVQVKVNCINTNQSTIITSTTETMNSNITNSHFHNVHMITKAIGLNHGRIQ